MSGIMDRDSDRETIAELRAELIRATAKFCIAEQMLGEIHMTCADAGIPPGNVVERVQALADALADTQRWRVLPVRPWPMDGEEVLVCRDGQLSIATFEASADHLDGAPNWQHEWLGAVEDGDLWLPINIP